MRPAKKDRWLTAEAKWMLLLTACIFVFIWLEEPESLKHEFNRAPQEVMEGLREMREGLTLIPELLQEIGKALGGWFSETVTSVAAVSIKIAEGIFWFEIYFGGLLSTCSLIRGVLWVLRSCPSPTKPAPEDTLSRITEFYHVSGVRCSRCSLNAITG